ncbi:tetratricopeptide repeat protein [Glycomyces sp. NPDC046736]|uniref:tetratricopeptide repeat protein n=1 Tax=Glycomyces sp. NPDC046736 TaxID=3155615 RepID=UPI00340E8BDE
MRPNPHPGTAQTLDDLADFLRDLRTAAGSMPFRRIRDNIRAHRRAQSIPDDAPSIATLHGYFKHGRVRMSPGTVLDIARALGLDAAALASLEQTCHRVLERADRSLIVTTRAAVPAPTPRFTGRTEDRARIVRLVQNARAAGESAFIVIEGMAGIGKTELAHQAARDLADAGLVEGPGLSADLRGYDPLEPPAAPDAVIRGFLGHLGVPGRRIDVLSPAARAALLHGELASRETLIVLDNAADTAQVEPLLPRGTPCVALVTSRRRLTDLAAATRIPLDVVTADEAVDLLREHDRTGRLDAAPEAALALVDLCRRLPLELAAVGRQLEGRPEWGIGDHVERLRRIPPAEHSGPVLALSYDGLPEPAQRLFRLLAIHPGRRYTAADVAALADASVSEIDRELTRLFDESLLLRRPAGAYEFHDSVRALAIDLANREDPASGQHAAVASLLRHYRTRLESGQDPLDADRADLLACLHVSGHDEAVAELANLLNRSLRTLGHYDEARICNERLLRLARRSGALAWEADALAGLAELDRLTGRFRIAAEGFAQARRLRAALGDRAGEADALRGLAQTSSNDDYPLAIERYRAALAIHRGVGNPVGEAEALWGLAEIALTIGDLTAAASQAEAVTAICRRIGNRLGEAYGMRAHADVLAEQGDLDAATRGYRASLDLCEQIGNRRGGAYAVRGLAGVALRGGDLDRAERRYRRALDTCHDIGDIAGEADARRGLAETALARSDLEAAADEFDAALPIYRETGDRVGEAHTLAGLGHVAWRRRDRTKARRHWRQALELAERGGLPLSAALREALDRNAVTDSV